MGAKGGLALKTLQWFIRGIQFGCVAVVLGIFSYFLATLHNHDLNINTNTRAVEGISGAAVVYTLVGLLLLCCIAGLIFTSVIAIFLDICFIGAFIYVAYENRHGGSSCSGVIDTPFGRGEANSRPTGSGGFTSLPKFRTACRLQTACLAVSIIAVVFFILSIGMELALVRHHRKAKRFGPSPDNNYTSGYGHRGGFFSRFRRRKDSRSEETSNLPEHTHPDQLDAHTRQSYGTETTAVNYDHTNPYAHNGDHTKYETGYGHTAPNHNASARYELGGGQPVTNAGAFSSSMGAASRPVRTAVNQPTTMPQPHSYQYDDHIYDRA